ncbi:hypothetical protein WI40_17185 [Burkholderia ubonensis]|uniref:hypothetical protein n=1 Tax=Burkholderia ubonensis TaxID=101571 RepID=UPI00075D87BF|nr:hypothetical protein [Burkholderia ubonensis]KUZ95464.1 hypothetical protein WI40_17185 [Burkholderia ubonensis]
MTTIYVQFTDASEQEIGGWFGMPQQLEAYPNCAEIDTTDSRWAAYYDAQPECARANMPAPTAS